MSAEKLPEGWETSSIGDLCKKVTDGSHNPPKASETGLPMLSAKNINNGSIIFNETHRVISEAEFWEENKRTNIESGDVLLTIVGTLGRTAVVPQDFIPFTLQRSVAVMSTSELEPSYFRYALENREFQIQIHENAKGTAQKGIYLNALKKLTINIAPKNEQKIITEKLDTLLAQIDSTKARLEQIPQILKRFRQAVLSAAISGNISGENDKFKRIHVDDFWSHDVVGLTHWREYKFSEIVDIIGGSQPPKSEFKYEMEEGYIRLIQIRDYKSDSHKVYIPLNKAKRFVEKHDVMIGRYGPPIFQILRGLEGAYNVALMKAVPKSELLDNEYLYWFLQNYKLYNFIEAGSDRTAGQSGVNKKHLESYPVLLPPIHEQAEIVRHVEQLFAYADIIEKQVNNALARVNNLTQSILAKAFRGELTAQWRAENPDLISGENSAAALLEKIKAERAANGGKKASRKKS